MTLSANDILRLLHIITPPVNIITILNHFGLRPEWVDSSELQGFSSVLDTTPTGPIIRVDRNLLVEHQRFLFAHQLYHHLNSDPTPTHCYNLQNIRDESAANKFAADLLVPLWMLDPLSMAMKFQWKWPFLFSRFSATDFPSIFVVSQNIINNRIFEMVGMTVSWAPTSE